MTPPRVYRTEALVLKGYNLGEADRMLTLCTPGAGKVRAIAKGARRTKSHLGGHVDLFTRSNLLVARGRQLDIVTQAETVENFRPIRTDLERLSHAHYVAELVEKFSAEQLASYPLYSLAVETLRQICTDTRLDLVVRSFELKLLAISGYRPQFHRCLHCQAAIEPGSNRFSSSLGGVLCPACALVDHAALPISVNALKILRNLQTNEAGVFNLAALDGESMLEVENRMREYITYRLESRPRSLAFLDQLRAERASI